MIFRQQLWRVALFLILCLELNGVFVPWVIASNPHLPQETTILELGKTIDREISGAQRHRYQLRLNEEQCADLVIEQHGIDIATQLFSADGKLITEFDNESRNQGTEKIEFVAAATGDYF